VKAEIFHKKSLQAGVGITALTLGNWSAARKAPR
jgi:hypothetical protein